MLSFLSLALGMVPVYTCEVLHDIREHLVSSTELVSIAF